MRQILLSAWLAKYTAGVSKYPAASLFLIVLLPVHLLGQSTAARVAGTVGDATGAVVPGASVIATNTAIAELVRARKYLAGAGPLGEDYQLKP